MGFWTIVPVKPLRRGKSRLAGVMNENERTALNICLLQNTLSILAEIPNMDHILVISRDPQALALARSFGARTLLEHSESNLNRALEVATSMVKRPAHRGLLLLPADLPLLLREDIENLMTTAQNSPVVSIVPDRHGAGTNALLVSPPGLIRYSFGIGSFQRHCAAVAQSGARLEIVRVPSIALDLDIPEDLALVKPILEVQIEKALPNVAKDADSRTQTVLNYKQLCLELISAVPEPNLKWPNPLALTSGNETIY